MIWAFFLLLFLPSAFFLLHFVFFLLHSSFFLHVQVIGRQMIRSGTSVGANYREAYRARSKAEFIAKVGECLKEIEETGYWLELLVDSGIVSEERLASLTNECSELTAIFVASIRTAKSNQ